MGEPFFFQSMDLNLLNGKFKGYIIMDEVVMSKSFCIFKIKQEK